MGAAVGRWEVELRVLRWHLKGKGGLFGLGSFACCATIINGRKGNSNTGQGRIYLMTLLVRAVSK